MYHTKTLQQLLNIPTRTCLFILVAMFMLAGCSNSNYEEGVRLAMLSHYAQAYKQYQAAAHDGYTPAMLQLGNYRAVGRGVKKDMKKAEDWYLSAYRAGDENAIPILGKLYLQQKRYTDALVYLRKGLHTRDGETVYLLAHCYEQGWGTPQDKQKAIKYYLLAANLGYSRADKKLRELGVNSKDTSSSIDLPIHSLFMLEHPSVWFILFFLNLLILPVYIKLFFDDWQDFGDYLREMFVRADPDESLVDDIFDRYKVIVWFIFYLSVITAQYKLVTALFY